jgi:hypothetical protein
MAIVLMIKTVSLQWLLLFDYKTINNPIASSLPAYSFWFPTVNSITNYVNQYFIEIFWTLKTLIPVILSVPILFLSLTQVVSSAIPANLVAMALPASLHKPSDEGLLVYQNNTYGVYVRYPTNWTSNPGEGNDNNTSVDIVTFSPSGRDQNSSSTVDLSIENVDSGESLTQYVSDSISDNKIDLQF